MWVFPASGSVLVSVPTTVPTGALFATLALLSASAVGRFIHIRDGNGEDLVGG